MRGEIRPEGTLTVSLRRRLVLAARGIAHSRFARSVRAISPAIVRRTCHRIVRWIDAQPMHLVLAGVRPGATPTCVVILGAFANDWIPQLAKPDTWKGVEGIKEVDFVPKTDGRLWRRARSDCSRIVVIPLSEDDIVACPRTFPNLAPDLVAVETLRDKIHFAQHAEACGCQAFVPRSYMSVADVGFPCVVKPARAAFGHDVRIIGSARELDAVFPGGIWDASAWVCQEYIPGKVEYALHCIFDRGHMVWHCAFRFDAADETGVRRGIACRSMEPFSPPQLLIGAVTDLLRPLRYSGPCCVDFKLVDGRGPVIFEINPRFGGSLMMQQNQSRLSEALRCIVERAS